MQTNHKQAAINTFLNEIQKSEVAEEMKHRRRSIFSCSSFTEKRQSSKEKKWHCDWFILKYGIMYYQYLMTF